jgi:Domain of unknown function (DUF4340)
MKTWKNLILPAAIFVVLLSALLIYQAVQSNKPVEESTATTQELNQYLINVEPPEVQKMVVVRENGDSFSFESNGLNETEGLVDFTFTSSYEDTSSVNISQTQLNYFVDVLASLSVTSMVVEKDADLKEYGLDTPACTVTYTLTTGETHKLVLGDVTYDDRFVYCMMDDSGVVYTTYKIVREKCAQNLIDFLDTTITSLDITDVSLVTFYRQNDDLTLVARSQEVVGSNTAEMELGWVFEAPFHITANSTFTNLVESVFDLSVSEYVEQNVTDLSAYSLDEPAFRFSFKMKDGTTKELSLSRDMGGIYYGVYSDSPDVFSMRTAAISGIQTPALELIKAYTCYEFIKDIVKIDAVFPEGSFVMDIVIPEGQKMTDDGAILNLNGQEATVKDSTNRMYYANLFESISTIEITGIDFDAKPVNTKDISITLDRIDGTSIVIDLAVKDKNTYYAFINGVYEGFLVDKEELYKDNGVKLYDYGTWAAYQRTIEAVAGAENGIYDIAAS